MVTIEANRQAGMSECRQGEGSVVMGREGALWECVLLSVVQGDGFFMWVWVFLWQGGGFWILSRFLEPLMVSYQVD